MATRQQIPYNHGIFSITITCLKWMCLIDLTQGYDLFYKWFDFLKAQRHSIVGFTIMPNHLHAVIAFRNAGRSINKIIGEGKRFIGYQIIDRLEDMKKYSVLKVLADSVNASERNRGKKHELWQDSFDWKECRTDKMIIQKLDYIHYNPCQARWNLVEDPADYVHSSAKFYLTGEQGFYPVTHYADLDDIDLSCSS